MIKKTLLDEISSYLYVLKLEFSILETTETWFSKDIVFHYTDSSDGNRFQFPKSIIGNKSNSILELESVSWCADCGI